MRYRQFLPYNVVGAVLWAAAVTLLGYFLGASWNCVERWIGRASAIISGLLLFALFLAWLWRWLVNHENAIRQGWAQFLHRPRVDAARRRFAPQILFLQARLSPRSYLGLKLTVGAAVLIGASWLFGGIAEDVVSGDPLTVIDVKVAQWFHAHTTGWLTQVMAAITHAHGTLPVTIAVVLLMAYLAWRRNWYWLLCVGMTVPLGMLLNVAMKYSFHRVRPSFENPLLILTTYSFPSGHTAAATLLYGVLASMLVTKVSLWRRRVMIVLAAFAMVALVALTRVYLGVHYLSDVLAAMAEGVAWLALCLTGVHTFWEHRRAGQGVPFV